MPAFCPTCRSLLLPNRGSLACPRCTVNHRARVVTAQGRRIQLAEGQRSLAAPVAVDGTIQPEPSRWDAKRAGQPHPVLGLFPYNEIRDGQRRMARDVGMAVQGGRHLVAQAPTGIGKTAAALGPALEAALAAKKVVMFLTSRQSQHAIAVDTLRRIQESRGVAFSVVDLVGKRDMCLRPEASEMHPSRFPDFCSSETRNKSCKFLGVPGRDTLEEVKRGVLHVQELMHVARGAQICPHILALAAAKESQVIIADYNHLFSDIREQSLERLGLQLSDIVLIVDEAHNLPDRIRQSHAHRIGPALLDAVQKEAKSEGWKGLEVDADALRAALNKLADTLPPAPQGLGGERVSLVEVEQLPEAFERQRNRGILSAHRGLDDMIQDLYDLAKEMRKTSDDRIRSEELAEALDDWGRFRNSALRFIRTENAAVELHVRLLDPGAPARLVFNHVHSAILMSGTLRPPDMVRDLLGLESDRTAVREYPSPFPPENRLVLIAQGVSTRFSNRDDALWDRLAAHILGSAAHARGNVAVFASSYAVAGELAHRLRAGTKPVIEEKSNMVKSERAQVLDDLVGYKRTTGAILVGVVGGSFSEGVDFKDNLLSMVVIVGLPLAPPDLEVQAMTRYMEARFPGRGHAYGYTYPAMTKVLQAMGRGVRGPTDKCLVLLLDERFQGPPYRTLLPDVPIHVSRDIVHDAELFLTANGL